MANMERSLLLKRMVAVDGARFPKIAPLDVHTAMKAVFDKAQTVGDRHYPAKENVKAGKRCLFLEPTNKKGASVLFHAYAYTAGHTPDQVITDFDAKAADIKTDPILLDGEPAQIVERFACLVLGDAMIIENARVYGAADLAVAAIRDLIRRHHEPKYPRLILEDAPNRGFKHLAHVHGGVVKVTARLNKDFTPEPKSFGRTLESLFSGKNLGKFKQVSATIEADPAEPLDAEQVLQIVDESETSSGLSSVAVTFGDGTALSDLQSYRERHRLLNIQEVRPGVPAVTEIETGMLDYLKQLVSPDDQNARVIDVNGLFV